MKIFQLIKDKTIFVLLPLVIFTAGCDRLHDDLSGCNLFLRFRYDYNLAHEDWFCRQVEQVQVFVFDGQDKYLSTFKESGDKLKSPEYKMQIPYQMQGCTFVVWAGKTENLYSIPTLTPGDPIEKLTLKFEPQDNKFSDQLDALWHSGPDRMIFPDENETTQTVSLIRNTNEVSVGLSHTDGSDINTSDFDIVIKGANGSYDYRNTFLSDCCTITYSPYTFTSTPAVAARISTLRFVKQNKVTMSILNKQTGGIISIGGEKEIDLVAYFLKRDPDAMEDQEYLDRRYIWDVSVNFDKKSYIALSITINGWTTWFQPSDI